MTETSTFHSAIVDGNIIIIIIITEKKLCFEQTESTLFLVMILFSIISSNELKGNQEFKCHRFLHHQFFSSNF